MQRPFSSGFRGEVMQSRELCPHLWIKPWMDSCSGRATALGGTWKQGVGLQLGGDG